MEDERIIIRRCPLCQLEHDLKLTITRSVVVGMSPSDARLPTVQRRFLLLITCPEKKERFQAEVTLPETALSKIRDIEISEG